MKKAPSRPRVKQEGEKLTPTRGMEESPPAPLPVRNGQVEMSYEEKFTLLLALMMVEHLQKKYAPSRGEVRVVV